MLGENPSACSRDVSSSTLILDCLVLDGAELLYPESGSIERENHDSMQCGCEDERFANTWQRHERLALMGRNDFCCFST